MPRSKILSKILPCSKLFALSPEEESFGTIPYLGTFLTDLTVIDTKMSNYLEVSHVNLCLSCF